MTHIKGKLDRDIHYPNGDHISTPPTTSGSGIERWMAYLTKHLAAHVMERLKADLVQEGLIEKGPIEGDISEPQTGP